MGLFVLGLKTSQADVRLRASAPLVRAGHQFSCAIENGGKVRCWGKNDSGQAVAPVNISGAVDLAVGFSHACALTNTGAVRCWGNEIYGKTAVPRDLNEAVQITAGGKHTCALEKSGRVRCWGGEVEPYNPGRAVLGHVIKIGGNSESVCALGENGKVTCWGGAQMAQLQVHLPQGMNPTEVSQIVVRYDKNTCLVTHAGQWMCATQTQPEPWPLGVWTYAPASRPVPIADLKEVTYSLSGEFACALGHSGQTLCWGEYASPFFDKAPTTQALQISISGYHWCALDKDKNLACSGSNLFGESATPKPGAQFRHVAVSEEGMGTGGDVCLTTATSGEVECWSSPKPKFDLTGVVHTVVNSVQVCAVVNDGSLKCWRRLDGAPTATPPLSNVQQIVGYNGFCALHNKGSVFCWPDNVSYRPPKDLNEVTQISMANSGICALEKSGRVRCWGAVDWGLDVPYDLESAIWIASGRTHHCAVLKAGNVRCWGSYSKITGDNAYLQPPPDLDEVVQVAAGNEYSCALEKSGRVRCWGRAGVYALYPPEFSGKVTQISATDNRACALTEAGRLHCWGTIVH